MKLRKSFYSLVTVLILLTSCAGSNIDKILKQGNVFQKNYKTTIPFKYVNGWIVIKVEINNKAYDFILDTGHSNLITTELAQELESDLLGSEEMYDINNTQTLTNYTQINNVRIGNIDFQHTISSIVDLNSNMASVRCSKIFGLIGSNLMRKAVWDFDFQNQLITIVKEESQLDIPNRTIDSRLYIGTAGIPSVTLRINGKKVLNNTVDFGNSGTNLLRLDYFEDQLDGNLIKKYVKGSGIAIGGFGRAENKPFHHIVIDKFKIGDHSVNGLHTRVKSGAGNNLGLDFFKNYRVILNWNKKRMRMVEVTKAGDDSYETYGFSTLYEDGGIYVNDIVETSSAFKFLKQNDKVLRINDTGFSNITDDQYCAVHGSDLDAAAAISITILRNGKELTFELVKTKLL